MTTFDAHDRVGSRNSTYLRQALDKRVVEPLFLFKPWTTKVTQKEIHMRTLRTVSLLLVIVGALNWLLVGLFGFDLVAALTGNTFGEKNALSSIVYVLVGLAGIALIPSAFASEKPAVVAHRQHA